MKPFRNQQHPMAKQDGHSASHISSQSPCELGSTHRGTGSCTRSPAHWSPFLASASPEMARQAWSTNSALEEAMIP